MMKRVNPRMLTKMKKFKRQSQKVEVDESWAHRIEDSVDKSLSAIKRLEVQLMKIHTPEPELCTVERLKTFAVPFKADFECDIECEHCTVDQRNACWLFVQKEGKKKSLLGGLPYSESQLREFKRNELVVICGALNLNPFKLKDKSGDGVVKAILQRQEEAGLEGGDDDEEEEE